MNEICDKNDGFLARFEDFDPKLELGSYLLSGGCIRYLFIIFIIIIIISTNFMLYRLRKNVSMPKTAATLARLFPQSTNYNLYSVLQVQHL